MFKEDFLALIKKFPATVDFSRPIEDVLEHVAKNDVSHDASHVYRVLKNAWEFWKEEGGDPDIIIAGVLFHDAVVYPKNASNSHLSTIDSAKYAEKSFQKISFPDEKLERVKEIIVNCSFNDGKKLPYIESDIVQDADMLEAVGALSVMRTFASAGDMKKKFYHFYDPMAERRTPDPAQYAFDLFPARLEKVQERLRTKTALRIAEERGCFNFLKTFKNQLEKELWAA